MPPKKDAKSEKGQLKALEKAKQKAAEDKTFGLKNKNKSAKVQKFVSQVKLQAKHGGNLKGGEQALKAAEIKAKEEKQKKKQQQAMLAAMYASEAKKTNNNQIKEDAKIDVYQDQREQKETDWNPDEVAALVEKKHGNQNATTKIVCKHFIAALENRTYGWFWSCPNGGDTCIYRHALPVGYVLKRDQPKEAEEDDTPIEEIVEIQRAGLTGDKLTPVTHESFMAWKKRKEEERMAELERLINNEKKKGKKGTNVLSGKDLFTFDPTLFVDDDEAAMDEDYEEDEEEDVSESKQAVPSEIFLEEGNVPVSARRLRYSG